MLLLMSTRYRSSHHVLQPFRQQHDCVRWCHHLCPVLSCRVLPCRCVDRIETASFLSATGVGPLFTVACGVFTARQMKNELLTVCVRSRIQNELRDSHLLHERLPPSCLLVVPLHGHHLGVIPVVSGYRSARPATEAPDHVHCYLRGRRCTAAPNGQQPTNTARTATSIALVTQRTCQSGTVRIVRMALLTEPVPRSVRQV